MQLLRIKDDICVGSVVDVNNISVLSQSVERLNAERDVTGSILGARPILRVLKILRNEGTSFALQAARSWRGSDDHVKWRSGLK